MTDFAFNSAALYRQYTAEYTFFDIVKCTYRTQKKLAGKTSYANRPISIAGALGET
ncbi:MAG: hypothetical protein P8J74_01385 [Woeseiaceae bacterium]|nr:hypothetical protein [Woeseiaceae bacterium]